MARGTAEKIVTTTGAISSLFAMGMIVMLGEAVATTEPATEQTGQTCEAEGPVDTSAQKWNCAPTKTTARSNAKRRTRLALLCMCLLRRSLGWIGCRVKQSCSQ